MPQIESLQLLVSNKNKTLQYLVYEVDGLGSFRRAGGKWVPDLEEFPEQFDDMQVFDIDMAKATELLARWDERGYLNFTDIPHYRTPDENE